MKSCNFDAILWDIDNAILYFPFQEENALKKCFSKFKLKQFSHDILLDYRNISKHIWNDISNGTISKEDGLIERFNQLFSKYNIKCSAKLFNEEFQVRLGDKVKFNDNSKRIIKNLSRYVKQYAVTDGTLATQERELKNSKLDKLFNDIFISESIGYTKPNIEFFNYVLDKIPKFSKDRILILGDSLNADIVGGNNAKIKTCWYNPHHLPRPENIKIDYEIDNLNKIYNIIYKRNLISQN